MIQGTSEDVAHRICTFFFELQYCNSFFSKKKKKALQGFSAVPKNVNDLGYFSLGIFFIVFFQPKTQQPHKKKESTQHPKRNMQGNIVKEIQKSL